MKVNRLDRVYTKDHHYLGVVQRLFHRTENVRPGWKHYAAYMQVQSFSQGDDFYVPTDFVAKRDPQTDDIILSVTERSVERKTWTRLPEFVLHGEASIEELTDRVTEPAGV